MSIKLAIKTVKRQLERLEELERRQIIKKIIEFGYLPDEVIKVVPLCNPATKARLLVFLEYEELQQQQTFQTITEIDYACAIYPEVVIGHLNYYLDYEGVAPFSDLKEYKQILCGKDEAIDQLFAKLGKSGYAC